MAIARWELEQRRKGNSFGADIATLLYGQYGDIELPEFTPFNGYTKDKLNKKLFLRYRLNGETIQGLRDREYDIRVELHDLSPHRKTLLLAPALTSEVAVDPRNFPLPDSDGSSYEEQLQMVNDYSDNLSARGIILGAKAVIGEAIDYIALFARYGTGFIGDVRCRTATLIEGRPVIVSVNSQGGVALFPWSTGPGDVEIAPLIIPEQAAR